MQTPPNSSEMGFYLTHIFECALLIMNAMAILNEQRFLKKCVFCFPLIFFKKKANAIENNRWSQHPEFRSGTGRLWVHKSEKSAGSIGLYG